MQVTVIVIALTILAGLGHSQDLPKPGACGVSAIKPTGSSRIVNGEAVVPHSRPYQLLLMGFHPNGTAKSYCGASLVKPTHALTAAHCTAGYAAKDLRVFAGVHDFDLSQLIAANGIPVREYYMHEKYNNRTLANDVAVIRLQVPAVVDNLKVGLVCLAEQNAPICETGHPVVASGWGATTGDPNRPGSARPAVLQQVALKCVDANNTDCKALSHNMILGISLGAEKSKMCAYTEWKGVCFGDSGGPLVRERTHTDGTKYLEQVGIMSGTIDCSFTKARPDVYASVRFLYSWILQKINASA